VNPFRRGFANDREQPGNARNDRPPQVTPPTILLLVRGHFCWWWQVLGSNQRRLSRRFYRPLPLATRATCQMPPRWAASQG
jgi:hypothetical protein